MVETGSSSSSSSSPSSSSSAAAAATQDEPSLSEQPTCDDWGASGVLKGIGSKTEMVRLIIQSLQHLGYNRSAAFLEKDSGILMQAPAVTEFCQSVLDGKWTQVDSLIPSLGFRLDSDVEAARFLIFSQKFLELLESRKVKEALHCLRHELTPLQPHHQSPEKLHRLASLVMCTDVEDLKRKADWSGSAGGSRRALLTSLSSFLKPDVRIPENRLSELLYEAVQFQVNRCECHNGATAHVSLFTDHHCDRSQIPCEAQHVLRLHENEVWFVRFSNQGKMLASAGKDGAVILYDATSRSFAQLRNLVHSAPVSYVAWSPDDAMLLTCSDDPDGAGISLWDTATGALLRTFSHHTNGPVKACAWLPDGKAFVSGGVDKNVVVCSVADGMELHRFQVAQVNDLAVSSDGERLIIVCQEKKIRIRSLLDPRVETEIHECDLVTSLALSSDNRHLLVNICSPSTETHLWDLTTKQLVHKFRGQRQGRFVIRSCFGGYSEPFIASGSEDSRVYIWHRYHGTLIESLAGHTGTVNSVSWCPNNAGLLASASDDRTVRIWSCPTTTTTSSAANSRYGLQNSNGHNFEALPPPVENGKHPASSASLPAPATAPSPAPAPTSSPST